MGDLQNEPRPHRSLRWQVVVGFVVFIVLIAVGSLAFVHGMGATSRVAPTPTTPLVFIATPIGPSWAEPTLSCDEAIQKIEQHQIAFVAIHRNKVGNPAVRANAVTGIEVLPRGIPYQGDPEQSDLGFNSFLAISGRFPDTSCYPQVLATVQQVNKHLPKGEQVKVGWYYDVG